MMDEGSIYRCFSFFIGLALLGFGATEAGEEEVALVIGGVVFSREARCWSRCLTRLPR